MSVLLTARQYVPFVLLFLCLCSPVLAQNSTVTKSDTTAVVALLRAAQQQQNPDSSIKRLEEAAKLSIDKKYYLGAVQSLVAIGSKYSDIGKYEQATDYATRALPYAQLAGDESQLAFTHNLFGVIALMQGNYPEASAAYFKALGEIHHMDSNARRAAITIYGNIASLNGRMGQNDKKLYYLNKGEELARQIRMPREIGNTLLAGILINKGNYYLQQKPDSAVYYYMQVLNIADSMDVKKNNKKPRFQALALTNLGDVFVQKGEYEKAAAYCIKAIELAKDKFAYIAVAAKFSLAEAYRNLKKYPEAEALLLSTLNEDALASRKDQQELGYFTLAKLYKDTKEYKKALDCMDTLIALKDTLMNAEKAKEINQLDINFKTAEKDKQIALQQNKINNQRIWMAIACSGVLVILLLSVGFYRISMQRRQLQSEQIRLLEQEHKIEVLKAAVHSEDNERTRIARELHDGIGGMLSAAMMRFSAMGDDGGQGGGTPDYRIAIDILGQMGDEIRKTAHNLMPEVLLKQSLPEALRVYCDNIQEGGGLRMDFQSYGAFDSLSENFKLNVYRIVQELVKNILQHAKATEVLVQLMLNDNVLSVTVEDNGVGFDKDNVTTGIGLYNLQTRVSSLDGRIIIQSEYGKGTSVFIEFDLPQGNE
ncbi:hypothetical protein CJD36_018265 [Flavipsychrobacter stenotrophus]|uniref:histidine kinase n=1 Tax=Flavipsychrobacter stenotrophus TaxID=2077091 RepID=A0A2S7SSI6_9BACT|nr:ATP-binding protein [Flavipsychrobacter stenotrophus]PQJ09870.1 hypothetical protein CJD36_018265 [Flavipsychrobacter stenotrophus]